MKDRRVAAPISTYGTLADHPHQQVSRPLGNWYLILCAGARTNLCEVLNHTLDGEEKLGKEIFCSLFNVTVKF
jgi:hypothetical protein